MSPHDLRLHDQHTLFSSGNILHHLTEKGPEGKQSPCLGVSWCVDTVMRTTGLYSIPSALDTSSEQTVLAQGITPCLQIHGRTYPKE